MIQLLNLKFLKTQLIISLGKIENIINLRYDNEYQNMYFNNITAKNLPPIWFFATQILIQIFDKTIQYKNIKLIQVFDNLLINKQKSNFLFLSIY